MSQGKDKREDVIKARVLFVPILLAVGVYLAISGCGGGQTVAPAPPQTPPPAGVAVSPTSATVRAGSEQQFTATVSPSAADQSVIWNVSGTGCTGASCGIIDATGKYTAPATVPNPPTVVVTARLAADSTKTGTAPITIINAPSSFSLNPTSLAFGNQSINTTSAPRTVTLTNPGSAAALVDHFAINGVNFANFAQTNDCPLVLAAGTSCTFSVTFTPTETGALMAVLVNDGGDLGVNLNGTGTAASPNNAKLTGQYAFLFSGFNSAGPMSVVGSFTADGNGNLIAGNTDVAIVGGTRTNQGLTQSTYSVGWDNSGTMRLNTAVNFPTDSFSFTFAFALDSFSSVGVAAGGHLIESDSTDQTGTGFFVKQDPAAFSATAINGSYAFDLSGAGTGLGTDLIAVVGRFTASGGSLSAGHTDFIGVGIGPPQTDQPFTGIYSVDGSGRGEATLNISGQPNPLGLISYVVSSAESLWMDAGGTRATGMALQQSGGPFNTNSLNGTSVFGVAGGGIIPAGNRPQNDVNVGEFQFDGMGNLSSTGDENYFGIPMPGELINGTYTVDSNGLGRGVMNNACGSNPFYLVSPGMGFILTGCDVFQFGTFEAQTGAPFSNASLSGNYVLGTLPLFPGLGTSFVSGVLSADGVGSLSGTLTTKTGTQTFAGTYSVAANGRATLSIAPSSGSPSTMVFYFVSPSKAVGVQMDLGQRNAAVNVIEK
jgi:hypothetical protein